MKRAPSSAPGAGHTLSPPSWRVWSALSIVYVIWGSTYLAIRVMVEDVPPLLGAGLRFVVAGVAMLAFLAARGRDVRVSRRGLLAAATVGVLLLAGGNGLVTVAEQDVPSGLAALLIASVPLWVVLLRFTVARERVARGRSAGWRSASAAWPCSCSPAAGRPRRPSAACSSSSSPRPRGRAGRSSRPA